MSTRYERMLEAISKGEKITDEPICRREMFLKALANKEGVSNLPEPICREEEFYRSIIKGEKITVEPICKKEEYLKAIANNEPLPESSGSSCREETMFRRVCTSGTVGGGSTSYSVTFGAGVKVLNGSTSITSGTKVASGTTLKVSYTLNANYHLVSFKVNGTEVVNNSTITVTSDVTITFTQEIDKYAVTFNDGVTVLNGSTNVTSGEQVAYGTSLVVSYTLTDGYKLTSFQVNGVDTENNATITVTGNIEIVFAEEEEASSGGGTSGDTPVIYGVKIDLADSNPETSVTYTDDAVDFNKSYMDFTNDTFEYGSWADKFPFNQVKPCLLQDGNVVAYLNPNNYYEDIDGNAVDITSTSVSDVMIEIPKIYYYMHNDDNYQYLQISNTKVNDNYCCLAHTLKGVENDKVYIGAYHTNTNGHTYSQCTPTTTSYVGFGTKALASNKSGWENNSNLLNKNYVPITYHMTNLLKLLFVLQFKSLDCRNSLGYGFKPFSNYGSEWEELQGTLNTKGLYYGNKKTASSSSYDFISKMKFMGMEDIWGNRYSIMHGLRGSSLGMQMLDVTQATNTWVTIVSVENHLANGWVSKILGTNELGFLSKEKSGSTSTYYCTQNADYSTSSDYARAFSYSGANATIFKFHSIGNSIDGAQSGYRAMYYPQTYAQ